MTNDTIQLAVDGSYGIHKAHRFFSLYPQFVKRLTDLEIEILQNNEHPDFFEVWEDFVADFEVMKDGVLWYLYEDGDLFFVSEHHKFEDD